MAVYMSIWLVISHSQFHIILDSTEVSWTRPFSIPCSNVTYPSKSLDDQCSLLFISRNEVLLDLGEIQVWKTVLSHLNTASEGKAQSQDHNGCSIIIKGYPPPPMLIT